MVVYVVLLGSADILASLTARLNAIEQQIKAPVLPAQGELPKALAPTLLVFRFNNYQCMGL